MTAEKKQLCSSKSKTVREVNFELLRIVCILLVIGLHFLTNSDLKEYIEFNSVNGVIYIFMKSLCYMADNLFVILSGYFLVKSTFKIRRIVELWLQVFFYSAGIYGVLVLTGLTEFSLKATYFSVLPVFSKQYWFFSCYLLLYFVFPVINKLIDGMEQRVYSKLLIIGGVLFSGIESLMLIDKDPFYLGHGKSLLWFVFLYLVGAYMRLYGANLLRIKSNITWLISIILLVAITTASYFALDYLIRMGVSHLEADKFIKLNSITIFPASVACFIFFKNIKIQNYRLSRLLVFLSPLTFGIYLIHDHTNFRTILWDFICPEQFASSFALWPYLIVMTIIIYIACGSIEHIREKLFVALKINSIGIWFESIIARFDSATEE